MLGNVSVRTSFVFARLGLLVLLLNVVANAGGGNIDLTFHPTPTKELTAQTEGHLALQPDGKIVVFGEFRVVNGVQTDKIARLNPDGTLDNSFNYGGAADLFIYSVVVQPDGKILIAGAPTPLGYQLVRLNADGGLDGSFNATGFVQSITATGAIVHAVQSDGKILASRIFTGSVLNMRKLYRVNSDGSADTTFSPLTFDARIPKEFLNDLIPLPGGKILIGGSHVFGYVFRVNPDGSKDTSFESPILGNPTPSFPVVTNIAMQSTGKVLFTGNFTTVNGLKRANLTRLNADGTLDLSFPETGNTGKIGIVSGDRIIVGNGGANGLMRLLADGTLDGTFVSPGMPYGNWLVDSEERIDIFAAFVDGTSTIYRFLRFNTDGAYDLSFAPTARRAGSVSTMALQPDGKIIVAGDFTRVNGVAERTVARLNSDGSVDPTFNGGIGFDYSPACIAVQTDGKVLLGGSFQNFNGALHPRLVRLESNGSLDPGFITTVNGSVAAIVLQLDGKILIGGSFGIVNGSPRPAVARLNVDGSLDESFNPTFATASVNTIAYHSGTDKIVIGGTFNGVSGAARSNIARLNSDGTADASFNAGSIFTVGLISPLSDGKYIVSSTISGSVKRLNADGTTDNGFTPTALPSGVPNQVRAMVVEDDGDVIVGGTFATLNGAMHSNIARLTSTGSIDLTFLPTGTDNDVTALVAQPDGNILVGGKFTVIGDVFRSGNARITTAAIFRPTNYDFDGDGKADISVYRPSNNYWYLTQSSDSQITYTYFGSPGDIASPGDYDGDGKTDLGIFRPSTGDWWYKSSLNGTFRVQHWGESTDIPIPEDFDGDGRTDFVVYRPSINRWYRLSSATLAFSEKYFGAAGDKPVIADFDGDGKFDPTIFRPSTGTFWYMSAIDNIHRAIQWGTGTDVPTPADFDGDGRTDAAVYRPSTGFWYIYYTGTNTYSFTQFGVAEDKTVVADYDGDGKADIAVYRPSIGTWYLLRSTAGFTAFQFGTSTDVPTPNAFVPQ